MNRLNRFYIGITICVKEYSSYVSDAKSLVRERLLKVIGWPRGLKRVAGGR